MSELPTGRLMLDTIDGDRKSTRLNSSHLVISYAVFCLKKKKQSNRAKERDLRRSDAPPCRRGAGLLDHTPDVLPFGRHLRAAVIVRRTCGAAACEPNH